jgi:non-ribosomal peptide synthase protein (TIGR01720 family)
VLQDAADVVPSHAAPVNTTVDNTGHYLVTLDAKLTRQLMKESAHAYHTQINDLLLTALIIALNSWQGVNKCLINLEGHGREELFDGIDISETVGWFTSLYPVLLNKEGLNTDTADGLGAAIKRIKETGRAIPHNGIGYGILRYLAKDQDIIQAEAGSRANLLFNFLGDFRSTQNSMDAGTIEEKTGTAVAATHKKAYAIEMNGAVLEEGMKFSISYSKEIYNEEQVQEFGHLFKTALQAVAAHCISVITPGYTPSDFPYAKLTQERLDEVMAGYTHLEEVYAATSMQKSIFFHALTSGQPGVYVNQHHGHTSGIDRDILYRSLQQLIERHSILRTAFVMCELNGVLQVVNKKVQPELKYVDVRHLNKNARALEIEKLVEAEALTGFEFETAPLLRVTLVHTDGNNHYMIMTFHHIILDGWSVPVLFYELSNIYESLLNKRSSTLQAATPYSAYMKWISRLSKQDLAAFWRGELKGLRSATTLSALPAAAPQGNMREGYEQAFFTVSEDLSGALKGQASKTEVTVNAFLVAAWALLLNKYTGQEDVVFGITVSGRSGGPAGIESMVGLFINTIPFRVNCGHEQERGEWIKEIQRTRMEIEAHSFLGMNEIARQSSLDSQQPLFDTLLVHQNYPVNLHEKESNGTSVINYVSAGFRDENNFPLTIQVSERKQLQFTIIYQRDLFDHKFIEQLAADWQAILEWLTKAESSDQLKQCQSRDHAGLIV